MTCDYCLFRVFDGPEPSTKIFAIFRSVKQEYQGAMSMLFYVRILIIDLDSSFLEYSILH